MAFLESATKDHKQIEEFLTPLIHGLPDDIALLCLARVPRRFHHILRCVSKRWRSLLCSEEWLLCRQKHNLEETWIYVMCKDSSRRNCYYVLDPDPTRRCWKLIQHIPPQCSKREGMALEALGRKLYLLGGCSWYEDATNQVYCYDSSANTWEEAASMPTARCYFVSVTLHGKIYATGGTGISSTDLHSWDAYDPHSTSWTSSRDQEMITDIKKLVSLEDKIYTIHEATNVHYAGVYDPSQDMWKPVNNEMLSCSRGPTVIVDGTLYMLDETFGTRLMRWQKETGDWEALGRLSTLLTGPSCQLAAIGRSIFVIGKGLRTVVVNADKAAKGRVLMCDTQVEPNGRALLRVDQVSLFTFPPVFSPPLPNPATADDDKSQSTKLRRDPTM